MTSLMMEEQQTRSRHPFPTMETFVISTDILHKKASVDNDNSLS